MAARHAGGRPGHYAAGAPPPPTRRGAGLAPSLAALAALGARRGYYYQAVAWCVAAPVARVALSPNRAAEMHRIRSLGVAWGTRLDGLRAGKRMLLWVSDATETRHGAQREARYRAVVALLEGGERGEGENDEAPLWRRFVALRAALPKVGRAAKREGR